MSRIITTSWDDGHPLDSKVGELLNKYGIRGTFYVPHHNDERPTMSEDEMRELSTGFEIGGHTYSHVLLNRIGPRRRRQELQDGKRYVSDVLGQECKSFAFPSGKYNKAALKDVVAVGHSFARTVALFQISIPETRKHLLHTTVQVFSQTRMTFMKHCLKRGYISTIMENSCFIKAREPVELVNSYLSRIEDTGEGLFHLWGHSWEIDDEDLWGVLEEICKTLSERKDFRYLTNLEAWEVSSA